jgi:ABC-type sugar transport system, periplasmic component
MLPYRWLVIGIQCLILIFLGSCKNDIEYLNFKQVEKKIPTALNIVGHWADEGKKEQMLKELINEFEFTNQDIKINMKYPEQIYTVRGKNNAEAKFNANAILSPTPEWDIIRINDAIPAISRVINEPGWEKKYLVDFSEIEEFRKNTRPELLTDKAKAPYGGIMPGPCIDGYNWALWYNSDIAKKIGIEVKQFDMTNEDFLNYIKAVYDYNKSHNDSIIAVYESGDWGTLHAITDMLYLSEIADIEEIENYSFSEKKLQALNKVLHEIEKYSEYKPLPKNWRSLVWQKTHNYPVEDKCLFFVNGIWMYNIWLQYNPEKIKKMIPSELPVFKPSPLTIGGYHVTWAVPKNSPHKEQAIKFLLFLNTPDVAEKWARYTKSPSGIKSQLTQVYFGLDKFEDFQYTIEKKYGKNKMGFINNSRIYLGSDFQDISIPSVNVFSGEITADQAMQTIKKQIAIMANQRK